MKGGQIWLQRECFVLPMKCYNNILVEIYSRQISVYYGRTEHLDFEIISIWVITKTMGMNGSIVSRVREKVAQE